MDFIFKLPKTSDKKTGILVVVDKLSKRTHFIALEANHNAKNTAYVFYENIYKHHGLPRTIISDRDSRFTGTFWKELMKLLNIKLKMSTAFHPQTDGQSERAFRTLQDMLRCYVSYAQREWSMLLPGLEFAYNNHVNDATSLTPFYAEYGQHPLSVADMLQTTESSNVAVTDFVREVNLATQIARTSIRASNARNADNVNENRRQVEYEVGDEVMLSTRHFSVGTGRVKKLAPKWIGPFKIVEKHANGSAYKLELPESLKNLHHTFHVSLLKRYHPDTSTKQKSPPAPLDFEDGTREYEIESLLGHRRYRNQRQYLVKWKGYDDVDNSWLSASEIHTELRKEYHDQLRFEDEPAT